MGVIEKCSLLAQVLGVKTFEKRLNNTQTNKRETDRRKIDVNVSGQRSIRCCIASARAEACCLTILDPLRDR